ncbi:MAG: phosphoribosylformylglycinamidine synthase subunit PurL, partial [bacterium]|nr:phosphoribosylformylglycinamidine synthase subunit PurL [bacterium]
DLDAKGREALGNLRRSGFTHIRSVCARRLYLLHGTLDLDAVEHVARALLCDPVTQTCACTPDSPALVCPEDDALSAAVIEVHYQAGVMDPVALSARKALNEHLAALSPDRPAHVDQLRTAWAYLLDGAGDDEELDRIARTALANECIETVYIRGQQRSDQRPVVMPQAKGRAFDVRTVSLRHLEDDDLDRLSRQAHLFLSRSEMETIRDYFRAKEREPTDLELETLAQTWSEHCVHKTLRSAVVYRGDDFGRAGQVEAKFDNLLGETIVAATRELNRDWCLSVFEDNAGVIAFDDDYGIAFKVETHNHPSAIEPYGGAATGIGGCIRDIMGCGLGAKPIASTDVFCVASPDYPENRLPRGVLHPARVLKGIVAGVRDYGNRMGIPTVNGAVYFDPRYLANPLVFCGSVGLIPREHIAKKPRTGDHIVVLGGRTGRDGIHGATFSSAELTETHADEFSHAVQIGNPLEQKKVLDVLLQARDHPAGCLYTAMTDCGAGGLSSAVGEMGQQLGAVVDLEGVPLKYAGLRYDEIWISEAQERMVLAVPPERLADLLDLCAAEDVEASVIGTFSDDQRLVVRYDRTVVGDLDMNFLHDGLPRIPREATWTANPASQSPKRQRRVTKPGSAPRVGPVAGASGSDEVRHAPGDLTGTLLEELSTYNIASKDWIIRQYDHEVQGGSVVKPLCGPGEGPGDAAVLRPLLDSWRGIALGGGLCPEVSEQDPYRMAVSAVDEALRNVICVGANPARVAILDNFCWGGCDTAETMGTLVRACKGAYDAALAYGLPFISGKDSLNNQFSQTAEQARLLDLPERIAVPETLLISAVGIIDDVRRCLTPDLKRPGMLLVWVARPWAACGLEQAFKTHTLVSKAVRSGEVSSAHDLGDGGLAVALAEMCIAGGLGASVQLDAINGDDPFDQLFEEYPTGYLLECADEDQARRLDAVCIGRTVAEPRLTVTTDGRVLIDADVPTLSEAWRQPLTRRMEGEPPR